MATTPRQLSEEWPGIPSWLNIDALMIDRATIQELVKEGRAMEEMVEEYARRVFQARCPTRLPSRGQHEFLPTDVFEMVERLSGSEDLYDVVDDMSNILQAAIDHDASKVIADRPHWAPEGVDPASVDPKQVQGQEA